jgi:hypothetical protein
LDTEQTLQYLTTFRGRRFTSSLFINEDQGLALFSEKPRELAQAMRIATVKAQRTMRQMLGLLHNVTPFTAFLGIGTVGFMILLILLLTGELFEQRADTAKHRLDEGGLRFLSARTLAVFVTAFGGTAAIVDHVGFSVTASCLIGILSGGLFATVVFLFLGFLYTQQASSDDDRSPE